MFPSEFAYEVPASVAEAVALLHEHGGEAKLIAGGHSLLPMMKLRLAQPGMLVDIGRIPELKYIEEVDGGLRLGALATHQMVQDSELVKRVAPLLAEVAGHIGDQQVRNLGTIGGSLAHGDPAADLPSAILVLEATITAVGPDGERQIPAGELFVDMLTTSLQPEEILTAVFIPAQAPHSGSAYEKFANAASGYALAGVAVLVTLDAAGLCSDARVGITGAGSVARRAEGVEAALKGARLDDATIAAAATHAAEGLSLMSDLHADETYRAHLVQVCTRRALQRAVGRAATGA